MSPDARGHGRAPTRQRRDAAGVRGSCSTMGDNRRRQPYDVALGARKEARLWIAVIS